MTQRPPARGKEGRIATSRQDRRPAPGTPLDLTWAAKASLVAAPAFVRALAGSHRLQNVPRGTLRCPACRHQATRLVPRVYAGGALRETVCGRCAVGRGLA